MARDFKFGLVIANGLSDDPVETARLAEASGFDVAVIGDHIGAELAPMPTLAAIAAATSTIRLGTMVLNADVKNPVQLAWEAASIARSPTAASNSASVLATLRRSTRRWAMRRTQPQYVSVA